MTHSFKVYHHNDGIRSLKQGLGLFGQTVKAALCVFYRPVHRSGR